MFWLGIGVPTLVCLAVAPGAWRVFQGNPKLYVRDFPPLLYAVLISGGVGACFWGLRWGLARLIHANNSWRGNQPERGLHKREAEQSRAAA